MSKYATLRSRPAQRADAAAVEDLLRRGDAWEVPQLGGERRVFEIDTRIVAVASAGSARVAPPQWLAEPVPSIERPYSTGDALALIGGELVLDPALTADRATAIHRLARTLVAQESGARWVIVVAPVPVVPGADQGEVVQQITHGGIAWSPVTLPVREGYWPVGIVEGGVVLVRRNDEF